MAGKNFIPVTANKNELNENEIFPVKLDRSINKIIENEGFLTYKVVKKSIPVSGNYMAELFDVRIEGIIDEELKKINLFIKFENDSTVSVLHLKTMYLNEIRAYSELFVIFNDMENTANVPVKEKYKTVKYYNTGNTKAVIMENLILKGYSVYDRWKIINLEYAELALKELAKFHSMSFAMEKLKPDDYERLIKNTQTGIMFNEDNKKLVEAFFNHTVDVLESDEAKQKVSKFAETAFYKYRSLLMEPRAQRCILCHGDYKVSNILVKEEEGSILDLLPIDYQLVYYGKPVNDILYFIFLATDQQFRKIHWDHLKNVYYETLENFLKYFGISSESVYSRKQFENDMKENLYYGLIASVHFLPLILVPQDEAPDFHSTDDASEIKWTKNDVFKKRINEIVEDFIQWGLI